MKTLQEIMNRLYELTVEVEQLEEAYVEVRGEAPPVECAPFDPLAQIEEAKLLLEGAARNIGTIIQPLDNTNN